MLSSLILAMVLQVGPNPTTGELPGTPDELLDRPPREQDDEMLSPESAWLAECLAMLPQEAARAHTLAQVRRNQTSGTRRVLANHCLGLAATQLGRWDEARAAFLAARGETPEGEARAKARFGTMAGNAALAAGDGTQAVAILEAALGDARQSASAPLEAIAAIGLSRALVSVGRQDEALEPLETATRLQPQDPESWLLKATLLRRLGRLADAQDAIERAAGLGPRDPRIALEAGLIAVLAGREDAARASWQSVIALAPESAEAENARHYIEQLEKMPGPS